MDWETFLGLAGLYIVNIVTLSHQWIMNKRILDLTAEIRQTLESRRELIFKTMQERMDSEKDD